MRFGDAVDLVNRRTQLTKAITAWAADQPCVLGLLLVGSGANGFLDEYSDLDVVLVTESGTQPEVCRAAQVALRCEGALFLTRWNHHENIDVLCALFEPGAAVDAGVWSIDVLAATNPAWRLLWRADEAAERVILDALTSHEAPQPNGNPVASGDDPSWWDDYHHAVAETRRRLSGSS